tara:strand:+ start:320 stop:481 length:162 start_codon:yes stop_codon:yes gene_type:complete
LYESHKKSSDEEDHDDEDKEDEEDEEVVAERNFGGSSSAHGARPKLQGVRIYS